MVETKAPLLPVKPKLGTWDAVSIIVGIVIGTTIFVMPPDIAANVSSPMAYLGAWALAGLLSLIGAVCYAELATAYPRLGGDYVYLSRAYGSWAGFLFGWAQLAVVCTSNIGMMAFIFGKNASSLFGLPETAAAGFAGAAVVSLSVLNILGVERGKRTQNVLSSAKVLGLGMILVAGLFLATRPGDGLLVTRPVDGPGFGMAMIFVLFAYGGWNDAAFVVAELRDHRNIPRALVIGITLVTTVYLLVNLAYLCALGFDNLRAAHDVPTDTLRPLLGNGGAHFMEVLVMISALGAANGLIFTGSRLFTSLGAEHRIFALLGRWNPRLGTPVGSLVTQASVSLTLIALVGTGVGRGTIDAVCGALGRPPIPWARYHGGFDTLLSITAPVFWTFFFLTGVAFFVLRFRDANTERPFALAVPWFPLLPLIFCTTCLYMLHSAVSYAGDLTVLGFLPVALGVPLYLLSRHSGASGASDGPG